MSVGMVVEQAEPLQLFGSAPTMLKPYVTPSFGFTELPKKCATVRVVGSTSAPPTVVVDGCTDESSTIVGSVTLVELPADAELAMKPTATATAPMATATRIFFLMRLLCPYGPLGGKGRPTATHRRGVCADVGQPRPRQAVLHGVDAARMLQLRSRRGYLSCHAFVYGVTTDNLRRRFGWV